MKREKIEYQTTYSKNNMIVIIATVIIATIYIAPFAAIIYGLCFGSPEVSRIGMVAACFLIIGVIINTIYSELK